MTGLCVVITTTGTKDLAQQIARELVASDLSSCAQISEVESIYKWDGKIHDDPEYRLVIKAKKSSKKMIIAKIKEMHDYDLPQIITIDISGGDAEYMKWLSL